MHNRPLVYETVFLLLQIASYVEEVEDRVEIRKELESDNAIGRKNVKERKKAGSTFLLLITKIVWYRTVHLCKKTRVGGITD